jgi:hypothetical protein
MAVAGSAMHAMTANKFEKYCETIRDILWDDSGCLAAIQQSCQVLDQVLGGTYDRDKAKESTIQTQAITIITANSAPASGNS